MNELAVYCCTSCGWKLELEQPSNKVECQQCGSVYMKWMNYEKWRAKTWKK